MEGEWRHRKEEWQRNQDLFPLESINPSLTDIWGNDITSFISYISPNCDIYETNPLSTIAPSGTNELQCTPHITEIANAYQRSQRSLSNGGSQDSGIVIPTNEDYLRRFITQEIKKLLSQYQKQQADHTQYPLQQQPPQQQQPPPPPQQHKQKQQQQKNHQQQPQQQPQKSRLNQEKHYHHHKQQQKDIPQQPLKRKMKENKEAQSKSKDNEKLKMIIKSKQTIDTKGNKPTPESNKRRRPDNRIEGMLSEKGNHSTTNVQTMEPVSNMNDDIIEIPPFPSSDEMSVQSNPNTPVAMTTRHRRNESLYRRRLQESYDELESLLVIPEKATKRNIIQAAIAEIKRSKKENEGLSKQNQKMRQVFVKRDIIGIIPDDKTDTSNGNDPSLSFETDDHMETNDNIEPEQNQQHYASWQRRQSARDGAKVLSLFAILTFCFINPVSFLLNKADISNGGTYTSRQLLSFGFSWDQDTTPLNFLISNLINIALSLFVLTFILLRGNPRCAKNSNAVLRCRKQTRMAQAKINKHDYEDAKHHLRIALFIIGNSCPKSFYGKIASFSWKCFCHILYQLGIVTVLKSTGRMIFPSYISLIREQENEENAANLSTEVYRKLHEISLKDPTSSYLEAACFLMNTIHSAEVSGDLELICTAYATAVIHMKEKVLYPAFFRYFFAGCAHDTSLENNDGYPFVVDWIFEHRGYEYFVDGTWDIKKSSQFYVYSEESTLDDPDLLQIVYAQFQDHILLNVLQRIVVPETCYPNEVDIILRERTLSFVESLGTDPVSEHLDNVSIYHQSLYGWWGAAMKHLMEVKKGVFDKGQLNCLNDIFEEVDEHHRHELSLMMKAVISSYTSVKDLKQDISQIKIPQVELRIKAQDVSRALQEATQILEQNRMMRGGYEKLMEERSKVTELIVLLCCELMIEARYTLWEIDRGKSTDEEELDSMINKNELLRSYSSTYLELSSKVQKHDNQIQSISGANELELGHVMRRTKYMKSVCKEKNEGDYFYYDNIQYPKKRGGHLQK